MWYSSLSLVLMKGNKMFCDKTISKTTKHINLTEKTLKENMEKKDFKKIKEIISKNEKPTKRVLKKRKFIKFNQLKHKPDNEGNQQTSENTTIQDTLKLT